MSENAENTTSNQLILLPEDSLVSLTVLLGSEEAQKMTATSGQSLSELLERQDQDMSLPRTFLESSPPTSTRCYLTWKVKATPAGRLIFQLAPSMPHTDENESLLWPTPTEHGNYNQKGASEHSGDGLATAVKMWPTPREFMHKDSHKDRGKSNLGEVVGGQLNSEFVEWLMGFPKGWTALAK